MSRARSVLLLACLAPLARAEAKVVFTGYGDFQATAQGSYWLGGSDAVLNSFKLGPGRLESRGASVQSLGFFATSQLSENVVLSADITYRDIGVNARTVRLQYAYFEWAKDDQRLAVGKILLPFGYYNQNYFYPFQRPSVSSLYFQGGILGLPIADIGAAAGESFELGGARLRVDLYGVNGYGPLSGSSSTFRSAAPVGALTIANNISGQSQNHRVAVGGRLEASPLETEDAGLGVSYYRGAWDGSGLNLFQMGGAHLRFSAAGFESLTEYLFLKTEGDDGMIPNFGSLDWRTDGFFSLLQYHRLRLFGKPIVPWARVEDYRSHGAAAGRESLWAYAGGVALHALDNVILKAEGNYIYYRVPYAAQPDLLLYGYGLQFALVATF